MKANQKVSNQTTTNIIVATGKFVRSSSLSVNYKNGSANIAVSPAKPVTSYLEFVRQSEPVKTKTR